MSASASTPGTVLITGASSGIGRAFAHLFARDGHGLVLVARREAALRALAGAITAAHGVPVHVFAADLAAPDGVVTLHRQLEAASIVVDVLVNNAGFGQQGAFAGAPLARQLEMIRLNVLALTELTGLLLPGMSGARGCGVLNVGSTAGFQPGPFMAVYYATKAYVVSFSEALAEELSGSGIRVTCLAPGPTATGFAGEAGVADAPLFTGQVMEVDEVAQIGYDAWRAGRPLVIAGGFNRFRAFLVRLFPRSFILKRVRALNERPAARA